MAERDIQIQIVHDALARAGAELAAAWKAVEAGLVVEPTDRLYFEDWGALCAVLTPKRYELLRYLRSHPTEGIRPLARALRRDVKRVHADVVALEEVGLITRNSSGYLTAPFDEITSTIRFAA